MRPDARVWSMAGLTAFALSACGSASPAKAATGPFLYVATKSDTIAQFDASPSRGGALTPLTPASVASGPFPSAIAISPNGDSAYVTDVGAINAPVNEVSQFNINPFTGQLTPKSPATVATGGGPGGTAEAIAITPNDKNAYVADATGKAISQYRIDPTTGDLIRMSPATVTTAASPGAVVVSPTGKYAYVVQISASTCKVWQYRVSPTTGALSSKPVASVKTGRGAQALAISPNGKSAYQANVISGTVSQYNVNPKTGKLTPKSPATVATGHGSHDLKIAPNGKNLYVVTVRNDTVSQYRINRRTGALSSKPVARTATGLDPENIVIAPNGKRAYTNSENKGIISQYAVNPTTGKLKPMSPATVKTTSGSLALAVTGQRLHLAP